MTIAKISGEGRPSRPGRSARSGGRGRASSSGNRRAFGGDRAEAALFWSVIGVLITAYVLGGGPAKATPVFGLFLLTGVILVATVWLTGGWRAFLSLPLLSRAGVSLPLAIPLLQLIPLPPAVWQALPGQSLRADVLALGGLGDSWQPMTQAPLATLLAACVAIVALALFAALLNLSQRSFSWVVAVIAGLIAVSAVVGILQYAVRSPLLKFHVFSHDGALIGFFANKNHMGLALACLILLAYEIIGRRAARERDAVLPMAIVVALVATMEVATNSRAGLILAAIAILVVTLRQWPQYRLRVLGAAIVGAAVAVVLASYNPTIAAVWDRLGDSADDGRWQILQRSLPIVGQVMPVGGGIGSFTGLFNSTELLPWLAPELLNNVHNDYVEWTIETGIPGLFALVLLLLAVAAAVIGTRGSWRFAAARRGDGYLVTGLTIFALFALHSLVDYPTRRLAAFAILIVALAMIFRQQLPDEAGSARGAEG